MGATDVKVGVPPLMSITAAAFLPGLSWEVLIAPPPTRRIRPLSNMTSVEVMPLGPFAGMSPRNCIEPLPFGFT